MNYFGNRQNSLGLSSDSANESFKYLHNYFKTSWLESEGDHPLQELWKRKDFMATNELYLLADSLKNLGQVDPRWVLHQVELAKSPDTNNQRGAFFELIGLNYLYSTSGEPRLELNKANQAGFDATLHFKNIGRFNISLKNYGTSNFKTDFQKKSKEIEKIIMRHATRLSIDALQVFIVNESYPQLPDWQVLRDAIPALLELHQRENIPFINMVDNKWFVGFRTLDDVHDLHPNHFSYKIHLAASHHPNEQKNLFSKLEDACINLRKHAEPESATNRNIIYIHLPADAPIKKCIGWTKEYFSSFPDRPFSEVIFYQPSVTVDLKEDSTALTHCFMVGRRPEPLWPPLGKVNFVIPIGVTSDQPSTLELHASDEVITIEDSYFYQAGHYYVRAKQEKDSQIVNIRKNSPGVFTHGVFDGFVMSGHFPPRDELVIV